MPSLPACLHCDRPVPVQLGSCAQFCCQGCATVYGLLQERGLGRYHELRRKAEVGTPATRFPATVSSNEDFAWLDHADVQGLYCRPGTGNESTFAELYLEGAHCAACVWLAEKVGELIPGVESVRLDLGEQLATVRLAPGASLGAVAREFARLGYPPHPVRVDERPDESRREDRTHLIRTGVAAACAGNIMLLAGALYAGADLGFEPLFRWLSFALSLPVVAYSAVPFYRSAWASLRTRTASIDLPIAVGTLLAEAASIANLFRARGDLYFDSLTSLVFLLLASRYVLKRAQRHALGSAKLIRFLTPTIARRRSADGAFEEILVDRVVPGDLLEVRAGECFPADGVVRSGSSTLDCSLLTGESVPVRIGAGQEVFAGTLNQHAPLLIEVTSSGAASRIGAILRSVAEGVERKAGIVSYADRISKGFVVAVLAAVAAIFGYGLLGHWDAALSRALALAIVTCPCAFALATPLAMSISIGRCARAGVLVKGGDVIEKLASVREAFLDKTGTLTTGEFSLLEWEASPGVDAEARSAVIALESRSSHPIAQALVAGLKLPLTIPADRLPEVKDFEEVIGRGVTGWIEGARWEIRRAPSGNLSNDSRNSAITGHSQIVVLREGRIVARAGLGDRLRPDSADAIRELEKLGVVPYILSGDTQSAVSATARALGIPLSRAMAAMTPEQKGQIVARRPAALMIGDGANDAVALARAHVGVAVHRGVEIALRAADAAQTTPGVAPVASLIVISRETIKVIRRGFWLSIAYNLLGGGAAVAGLVGPLFAAVLMPCSALTVFFCSILGTRRLRAELRSIERQRECLNEREPDRVELGRANLGAIA